MLNNFPSITPEDVETGKRVVEFGLWIWGLMKKKSE
jgi:hypothetical protein